MQPFGFLPGHRSIILNIPNQIVAMREEKERNHHGNPRSSTQNSRTNKFDAKKALSDQCLKSKLISNLGNFIQKQPECNIPNLIKDVHIEDFQRGANTDNYVCKCKFICPFCEKKIPAIFKHFWQSSNICSHLKSHF